LTVRWTDGPTKKRVKAICEYFEGSRFDGMNDIQTIISRYEINDKGEQVRVTYGPNHIFTERYTSEKLVRTVAENVVSYYDLDKALLERIKTTKVDAFWDVSDVWLEKESEALDILFNRAMNKTEADADGNVIKKRVSSGYLKNLAAKAFAQDDTTIFTDELYRRYEIKKADAEMLYLQYSRLFQKH